MRYAVFEGVKYTFMARMRSPNYPQLSLAEAIERIRRIYDAEHTHPSSREILVQHLGYSGLNGASAVVLGALNRYGLLEHAGDGLRVSDGAVTILELPEDDPERQKALRSAAFMPPLFAELKGQFGNRLPSPATLRHTLIKQGFLPKAADDVMQIYRDNSTLVGEGSEEYNDTSVPEKHELITHETLPQRSLVSRINPAMVGQDSPRQIVFTHHMQEEKDESGRELRFNLSTDSSARIVLSGSITQEAIRKLIKLLEISTDTFPSTMPPQGNPKTVEDETAKAALLTGENDT